MTGWRRDRGVGRREDPLERSLEHPAVGRAGQRVALGEVLDVAQQDGVAEVERRDRRELRRAPTRPAARRRRGPAAAGTRRRPRPPAGRRRRAATRARSGRPAGASSSSGLRTGSSRRTGRRSLRAHARATTASGSVGVVGASWTPIAARTTTRPSVAPRTTPRSNVEPRGEAVEDDLRLLDRIGHVVELRAQLDERLEVGPALAELALVHRREDRRREREQPERRDVEDRHPVELDRPPGQRRRPPGRARGLGIQDDEQQQRVPERDLQAGPVRAEQRDRDEMEVDEEPHRALRPARRVHREREGDAVDEEHQADDDVAAAAEAAPDAARRRGPRDVGDHAGDDDCQRHAEHLRPDGAPGDDDDGHAKPQRGEQGHPVRERRVVGSVVGRHQSWSSSRKARIVSAAVSGAARSLGSRPSSRDWISRNRRTAIIRIKGKLNSSRPPPQPPA